MLMWLLEWFRPKPRHYHDYEIEFVGENIKPMWRCDCGDVVFTMEEAMRKMKHEVREES
jgi:hypothetical protein